MVKSYLRDRQQKEEIKCTQTTVYILHGAFIKYGLLYGSVLGPLAFLKDLPPSSKPTSILFVDDASYHVKFRN